VFSQIISQARDLRLFLSALYCPALAILLSVAFASSQTGVSLALFTRDPSAVYTLDLADAKTDLLIRPFIGVVSNVGVLLWTASATICLFGSAVLRHSLDKPRFSTFLLCAGLLTTLLTLDDFFLLHETVFPRILGLSETVLFVAYGGLVLGGVITFRKCILETEYLLLFISLGFFGLSLFVDALQKLIERTFGDWRILLEDGFKLLGIVGWLGYFSRCSFKAMRSRQPSSGGSS
jgi:hypothetical protein